MESPQRAQEVADREGACSGVPGVGIPRGKGTGLTGPPSARPPETRGPSENGAEGEQLPFCRDPKKRAGGSDGRCGGAADRGRRRARLGHSRGRRASRRRLLELGDAGGLVDQLAGPCEVTPGGRLGGELRAGFEERGDGGGERAIRCTTRRLAIVVRGPEPESAHGAPVGRELELEKTKAAAPSVSRVVLRPSMVGATGFEPATTCTPIVIAGDYRRNQGEHRVAKACPIVR